MVPARMGDNEEESRKAANSFISKYCDLPAWSEATPNSAIVGTSRDCARIVERYVDAGVSELVLMPSVTRLKEINEQIERFGKELIPSFN